MPVEEPTRDEVAAQLRRDFAKHSDKLDVRGVDIDKVAGEITNQKRRVIGWEAPRVLPALWHEPLTALRGTDGTTMYQCVTLRLKAMLGCGIEDDGRAWLHLSVSHQHRIPTWTELGEAKRAFLGDREAYQVLPPISRYVNINAKVLHLFALLDENAMVLPDFTRGTGNL